MKASRGTMAASAALFVSGAMAFGAAAGPVPYPNAGTYNSQTYTFSATNDGDLIAYFAGKGPAADFETISMEVNGVASPAGFGLLNQTSSLGDSFDLGYANAGDIIIFEMKIETIAPYLYSDPSLNAAFDNRNGGTYGGGENHVYSTDVFAGQIPNTPIGTYVGFEDGTYSVYTHYDYTHETFVVTNVTAVATGGLGSPTPEPATWALLLVGFGGLGVALRRRRSRLQA